MAAPSETQPADAPANANASAAADSPNAITGWDRVSGAYAPPPSSGSRGGSARSSGESEPKSLLDAPFAPHGPFISVGFSLHRYTMKTLSMEQDTSSRRAFDGGALSVQAGYLARRGGFIGLDWAHHTGRNSLRTAGGESSLELNSDFVSLMTGLQVGSRVRAHLAVLVGVAHGEFMRSIRVEHADAETGEIQEQRDTKKTSANAFLLGADLGLIVMPTEWLAIGLHFRADHPFFNDALNGTAGIYAGLSATFVYPL